MASISLGEAADRQLELLKILETRNDAATEAKIAVVEEQLDQLRAEMAKQSDVIAAFEKQIRDRVKADEKTMVNSLKRFSLKFKSKKPEAKPEVEEEQDVAHLTQKRDEAKAVRESMFEQLKSTETQKKDLKAALAEQQGAVKELDDLYESAFDGPTPELPGEDELEEKFKLLRKRTNEISRHAAISKQVHDSLTNAVRLVTDCDISMNGAMGWFDVEHKAVKPKQRDLDEWAFRRLPFIQEAQKQLEQAKFHYGQAANLLHDETILPPDPISTSAEGREVSTAFLDTVKNTPNDQFTIFQGTQRLVKFTQTRFGSMLVDWKQRLEKIQEEETTASKDFERARHELVTLRRDYLIKLSEQPRRGY